MDFQIFFEQFINGITQGSVYALLALGFTMIFGTLRMFTFAHGEVYMMGAYTRADKKEILEDIEHVYDLFPVVEARYKQPASTLSGGEQQMVAMARTLMARPKLLIMKGE